MKKQYTFILILVILVLGIVAIAIWSNKKAHTDTNPPLTSALTTVGQCLTDKGVKFYGAYWCPHCAVQKALFKTTMKTVPYVECALTGPEAQKKAKEIIAQYNAGTYKGAYLASLNEAKSADQLSKWLPSQNEICVEKGIKSYPTWIYADGSQLSAAQAPLDLANKAGCTLTDEAKALLQTQKDEFIASEKK